MPHPPPAPAAGVRPQRLESRLPDENAPQEPDAVYADEFSIYAGNANRPLAERICRYLKTRMGDVEVFQFANENIFVRVLENVREQDVFLVQPTSRPVNQSIMELLIMIDAFKRASAGRITAVIPYYAYGRSDKKDQPRVPITARLVADMLTVAGADRVLTMDLHQGQIQGFFSIPVDELTAVNLIATHIKAKQLDDVVVVSELGFAKKARNFAELLAAPLAIVEKRRLGNQDRTEVMNIIGDVAGKTAVIIDDEIDTAGSLIEAVGALQVGGARAIYSCATHGVFSGTALERIAASALTEVIVTDTIPLPAEADDPRITVLSTAPLFGEAIKRIHRGESVGALFSSEVQMVEEMTFWEEDEPDDHPTPEPFRVSAG
ncbi:MAG TPA: ribose-phosphate pyrophosphokinase [Candidatus Limnocylindria bacterium]|nr:ribose-phosphate pyrophosphokinase [Candidatus Limnocylindria bacterium]